MALLGQVVFPFRSPRLILNSRQLGLPLWAGWIVLPFHRAAGASSQLEFMREPEVDDLLKNVFLVASFVVYYIFLFSLEKYAYCCKKPSLKFWSVIIGASLGFCALIAMLYKKGDISIGITVCYIYAMFGLCVYYSRKHKREAEENA